MRAGQAQGLTQELHQQGARIDVTGDGLAVHRHRDGRHRVPPEIGLTPCFSPQPNELAGNWSKIASNLPLFAAWNKFNSEHRVRGTVKSGLPLDRSSRRSPSRRHRGAEFDEEIVGGLLRGAVDQALTELGELAADLRLDVVSQERAAIL